MGIDTHAACYVIFKQYDELALIYIVFHFFIHFRKIEMFDVTRTGGRETNQTAITYLGSDRKAKITVTWVPTEADTGKDILCARVEDNFG